MTKLTLLSAAALAAAFTFTACKKDKKADKTDPAAQTPTDTPTADKPVEPTTPPAETPPAEAPPSEPAAPERPASVTDEQVKAADDFVAAVAAAASAAEGAKADCKAMAKALGAEAKKIKPLVGKLEAMKKANEKDTAAKDWFKAAYEAKVMDGFGKLMTAIEPCKTDKAVIASLKDIGPKKKKEEGGPAVQETEPTVK